MQSAIKIVGLVSVLATAVSAQVGGVCSGQACDNAALAGTTGSPWAGTKLPDDSIPSGGCCVISYNPSVAPQLYKLEPTLQAYCGLFGNSSGQFKHKRFNEGMRDLLEKREPVEIRDPVAEYTEKVKRQGCTAKTLIFARGTFETGTLGNVVGPGLQSALNTANPGQWTITGVDYLTTTDGDACLGLPGMPPARSLLEKTVSSCPNTKLFLSGYSQGGMVVRDAVAYTSPSVASHITGIYTFGDPFNGAVLKNFAPKTVQVTCANGDGVCNGEFDIGAAHLSYGSNTNAVAAQMAAS